MGATCFTFLFYRCIPAVAGINQRPVSNSIMLIDYFRQSQMMTQVVEFIPQERREKHVCCQCGFSLAQSPDPA
jgi:hypothetical protein